MRKPTLLLLTTPLLASSLQLPFFNTQQPAKKQDYVIDSGVRVAIIGAGAGGSSAAFWIKKANERLGTDVRVDVFERNDYIGGRSTVVHPYDDKSLPAFEIGASIFVDANRNLMRAAKEFNLTFRDFDGEDPDNDLGIWDGKDILFQSKGSWWDNARAWWRYGYSAPKRTDALVATMVNQYISLYTPLTPVWNTIKNLSYALDFGPVLAQTGAEYLDINGIGRTYSREIIESAARCNYGQNLDEIHALDALVSMAANGAYGIVGGNFQIFEQFLNHSDAKVHLNTKVTSLAKLTKSGETRWALTTVNSKTGQIVPTPHTYTHVILATPIHNSGVSFLTPTSSEFPTIDYVKLHVTLLSTTTPRVNAEYFNNATNIPKMLLTTNEGWRNGGVEPEFNSLSYHGGFERGENKEYKVKIFSKKKVEDEWLAKVFGEGNVGWVHRKVWDAYPYARPGATFPPVKPDEGLWYVNSAEPFISTMDTETISSRNIVELLFRDQYGVGICGREGKANWGGDHGKWGGKGSDGQIWGWDC
jgi:prenylcysteine oxidase/farnesylcysteine lyase